MIKFGFKKNKDKNKKNEVNKTALIYSLKTIQVNKDEILGINNHALSILSSIFENEDILGKDIIKIEESGKNLYASIQLVLEAADVLTEYATTSNKNIKSGISDVNSIIEQLSKFTENISNILSFIKPFKDYSEQIGSITDIIFNIAQMTESAARNAGIKAYHAGEYGRGFEVIADRMLLLANKTFKLTQKIPIGINKIQEYTESIIENIDNTKGYADNLKNNINELTFRLKNIEDNLNNIVRTSNKVRDFVSLQDTNKKAITKLNEETGKIINKNIASGERLSSIVKTQADIKKLILVFMEEINSLIQVFGEEQYINSAVSIEMKLFNKIENQLVNSRNIAEQIINVINEFINFNEEQKDFIAGYKKNIDAIEDNERMIINNIQDIDDDISLLFHAVNKFNTDIYELINQITLMKNHIQDLIGIFNNVSINLKFILDTSNELKELSEQTRLLSLYASIEAARAGKFQKSLSVIVIQAKELIKKATEASSDIQKIVNNMQMVINNVDLIIKTELTYSEEIESAINSGKSMIENINDSSENLKNLIKEIYSAINSQTEIRNEINKIYSSISDETNIINEKANDLFGILKQDMIKNENDIEMIRGIRESMVSKYEITKNNDENVLTMVQGNTPRHWIPALIGDASSNKVVRIFHSGLVKFGKDTNIVPGVAKYWSINEDASEWIFYLRNNVYFHDNTLLTSEDVKATFYKVLESPSSAFINMIKGAKDYIDKKTHSVEGIEIIDDFTIKFILEYPYISFIANLATTTLAIIKSGMVHYSDEQMKEKSIGCGPFKLESYNEKELNATAFENYYDGEAFIDRIKILFGEELDAFEMLKRKEIDLAELKTKEFNTLKAKQLSHIKLLQRSSLDIQYIGFNMSRKNEISKNKLIRQAMNYAIDKEYYINETMEGGAIPAKGIFPPELPAFNDFLTGYKYDIEKAKELMKQAGFPDGLPKSYTLTISNSKQAKKRGEIIKRMWGQIGIDIKLKPLAWGELLHKLHTGNSEIFMMGWAGDTGEADNFVYPLFHSNSHGDGGNDTFYSNKTVDNLIMQARKTTNPEKRIEIYRNIEKFVLDDAPMVFMSHNYNRIGINENIFGFFVHPLSVYPLDMIWKKWRD